MAKKKTTTTVKREATASVPPKVTVDALEKQVMDGGAGLKSLTELAARSSPTWNPETERTAARHALRRSFSALLERGELRASSDKTADEAAAMAWLMSQFNTFLDSLIEW